MYSVCILIYVSVYLKLPIYTKYIWPGCWRCLRAIRGAPEDDDRVNLMIHSEAVFEQVWRCNWSSRLSELRDILGVCNRASLETHLEANVK
jgi:hypothetical protein